MKLEDQYNTPEQGKHLVELGIDAALANRWHRQDEDQAVDFYYPNTPIDSHSPNFIPLFSVAELIEMIYGRLDDAEITMAYNKSHEGWTATLNKRLTGFGKTQAEATAAVLIFLLGGTYTAAECNERLKNA